MDTVEINWTVISYCVIGLFALIGFFRGWWKEAITTFLLGILVLLLSMPEVAQSIIDFINTILQTVWGWLPASMQDFITGTFGITSLQIDASSGQTWLTVLILMMAFSILLSRLLLPNQVRKGKSFYAYTVSPLGAFLGGLLGGLNGFLLINLVREYLTGTNLPTGTDQPATEMAVAGGQTIGVASSGVNFQVTDLPAFTQVNSVTAWIVIGLGVLLMVFALRSRLVGAKQPPGYYKGQFKNAFD